MKTGAWLNYSNGRIEDLTSSEEHSDWIRIPDNIKKLGLPDSLLRDIEKYPRYNKQIRTQMLVDIMQRYPLVRFRGHGNYVTYEFATRDSVRDVLDVIWTHGSGAGFGQYTQINLNNLLTREQNTLTWQEFQESLDAGDYRTVLRVARKSDLRLRMLAQRRGNWNTSGCN
jgi:hypothetical protein